MSLTPERITEKISQVEKDIAKLRSEGAEEKKVMTLIAYKEYLDASYSPRIHCAQCLYEQVLEL
jgi:hypothetical protein